MRRMGSLALVSAFVWFLSTALNEARAQCTIPYALSNGQLADASQVMANFNALSNCFGPGGATNSVQYNKGGTLGGIGPLSNGQLVIGASGTAPKAQTLTAGPGIAITNGAGSITIAADGTEAGNGLYSRTISTTTPTSSGLGLTNWLNQGTATVADNAVGITIDAPTSGTTPNLIGRYMTAPTAPYTITTLVVATRNSSSANGFGIGWYDGSAKLHVLSYTLTSNVHPTFQINKWTNPTTFNATDLQSAPNGFSQPIWLRIADDGTNVSFSFSQDGSLFVLLFSIAKASGYLGASGYTNLVFFVNPQGGRTFATLLSWIQT